MSNPLSEDNIPEAAWLAAGDVIAEHSAVTETDAYDLASAALRAALAHLSITRQPAKSFIVIQSGDYAHPTGQNRIEIWDDTPSNRDLAWRRCEKGNDYETWTTWTVEEVQD